MNRGFRLFSTAGVVLALALLSTVAWSQAISGDIVGTVADKSGAAIPNATVTATHVTTNVSNSTKTNAQGEYRFTNLPVGTYSLTAVAPGFATKTLKGFQLELNKTSTARLIMDVAKVSTTVEVSENALPPIDTTTAQLQTTYDEKMLQDLPGASMGSAGVLNLSLLQAGVNSANSVSAGTGPSVGGQRPRNNNFTIEGVDNNDKGVTGPLVYVPNDAVSNFSVLQNQFSPEFGHSSGGQFNTVVSSGSNTFHGRAYEYFQNRNLNAVDYSLANQGITSNPRYDNNRFGGQFGGPIKKNKLFFFANYEYQPVGLASNPGSPVYAPTAAGYNQLAAMGSSVSQANVNILKQYAVAPATSGEATCNSKAPFACVNGTPIDVGILPIVAPNYHNQKALTTSGDINLSDKDQIRLRYIYNQYAFIDNAATLPVFYTTVTQPYHLANIAEYHTFSATLTNEFRIGFNRTGYNYTVPNLKAGNLDAFPNLTIDELGGINVGPDPNAPQYSIQNTYQLVDNVNWIKGNHALKIGAEYRKWISPQKFIQRARGDYEWSDFSSFVTDAVPDFAERSFGSVGYSGDQSAFYWYVNDTWKVRPNLSLNLGLRYEFTGVPFGWTQQSLNSVANVPGLISFDAPRAPKNDFMPRVGFAWSPRNKTNWSVRGGFGMGYDVLYDNIGTLSRPPQIGSTTDCPGGTGCPTSNFLANGGIKPDPSKTGITTLSPADARANTASFLPNDVKYPYSIQWNLGVQHVFATNYTAEVRYVGTRGVHLNVQDRLNIQSLVTPNRFLPTLLAAPDAACMSKTGCAALNSYKTVLGGHEVDHPDTGAVLVPGTGLVGDLDNGLNIVPAFLNAGFYSSVVGFMPYGASSYHGLQSQLNRRFANGLQFQVAYTWSHTIDNSTADFFSTVLTPRRPQDFLDLRSDKSNSALDRRHRFTLSLVYDLPFFKHSNSFLKNVVGNWELTPTYIFETGQWADVQSGVDSNFNGDNAGDRAIFNPGGVPGTGSGVVPLYSSNTCSSLAGPDSATTKAMVSSCLGAHTVAYLASNPNAQYIQAAAGALANSSRNTLQTPGINNWDFGVTKRISVTERYRLEFAAQAANVFNHPQFIPGFPNIVNASPTSLVTASGTRNYLEPQRSNFNNPKLTFPSNARYMQLGLKFIF